MVTRTDILKTAGDLIGGDRHDTYGDARASHRRIADMWEAYLGDRLNGALAPADVAAMMILLKVSRSAGVGAKKHVDNWVDIAGYSALAGEMESE